jgi:hypothetical protein
MIRAFLASVALALGLAVLDAAQTAPPAPPRPPDFTVQVWGSTVADFTARVNRYVALRAAAAVGSPPLVVTDHQDEITRAEVELARRIRQARGGRGERGDFFTSEISQAFRRALADVIDDKTREVIMDDNPGAFTRRVGIRYPKTRSYSTVPANVLALLPVLPVDMEYRFLGRHLILLDVRSNVIVDLMRCAMQCD